MPVAGCGFAQRYDAQTVVAADVTPAANDKQQLEPMLNMVAALPDELGEVQSMLADNGYFSAGNAAACAAAEIEPVITMGRQPITRRWPSALRRRRPHRRIPRWSRLWRTG
jgi:hypothetical protein